MQLSRAHPIVGRAPRPGPRLVGPVPKLMSSVPGPRLLPVNRVAAPLAAEPAAAAEPSLTDFNAPGLSYSEQYDRLYAARDAGVAPLNPRQPLAKPDPAAQAAEPGARRIALSGVWATPKTSSFQGRANGFNASDRIYLGFMAFVHGLALLAPLTFSWANVGLFFGLYFVTGCLGITLSYHRQLSHKSFQTPKWLEYVLAYCGVLAGQGDPMMWVSHHKYHHLHTDTPLDPHSIYEGFWWSHCGWLFDNKTTVERAGDRSNVSELESQAYYRFLRDTYPWHLTASLVLLYALGGLPALVWGGALRLVWVYHVTWFVNSATHTWGYAPYDSGDQSRNNWWVGILAFGEGWHNAHHTFEWSARHGLEWWEVDVTWGLIWALQKLGLAKHVKLPTERQLAAKRIPKKAAAAAAP